MRIQTLFIHTVRTLVVCGVMGCVLVGAPRVSTAKTIGFEATVNKKNVSLGESIELRLAFTDTQNIPAPQPPQHEGLEIRYLGPSTMMSIVNGRMSSSITHIYTILPLKSGSYRVGPFSINHKNDTYVANAITITVEDAVSRGPTTAVQRTTPTQEGQVGIDDYVFLTMEVDKQNLYMNERVPVTIRLYVNRFSVRDIQYPEFAHEGFSREDFEKPEQYQKVINGIRYEVVEFRTYVFGTRPGVFALGPAELQCNLLMKKRSPRRRRSVFEGFFSDDFFDGFFGRYERRPLTARAPAITLTILPLPTEGKPADYEGALGDFTFRLSAEPREVTVGDPISLKMIIRGTGNLQTVTAPQFASTEDFKVYEPHVEQKDRRKIFEQVILPTRETVTEIPALSFSFFDTNAGKYKTITQGPVPITVNKPREEDRLTIIDMAPTRVKPLLKEVLGRDIIYIKESPGALRSAGSYLFKNTYFQLFHLLPPMVFVGVWIVVRRRERLQTDIRYARRLHAPKKAKRGLAQARALLDKGKAQEFYDAVFKTLQEYLGDKFHLPSAGITIDVVNSLLVEKHLESIYIDMLKDIFRECDMVRYAPAEFKKEQLTHTFARLKQVIDYLERQRL